MKLEISLEKLEELVLCVVHNNLSEDDAIKYAKAMILECNGIEPPEDLF